jgi:hypothetical protein
VEVNQPYLFRDSLSIECVMCGNIQKGDTLDAPKAEGICEECELKDVRMREGYDQAIPGEYQAAIEGI